MVKHFIYLQCLGIRSRTALYLQGLQFPEIPKCPNLPKGRASSRPFYFDISYIRSSQDVLVSSFDFPPTSSLSSSVACSFVRNSPCEQPNLRLPHILNSSFSL